MSIKHQLFLTIFIFSFLLGACTRQIEPAKSPAGVSHCQIIYDAGSSGTRLYIYELTAHGWLKHQGPKTGALADPIRGNRGKTMSDAKAVVEELVAALDGIRSDGPLNKKNKHSWPAFDWREKCNIDAAAVYATAGMRLAEQQDAQAAEQLWRMLNDGLSAELGMTVVTRTISGFEEGLFAWLSIREGREDENIGVAEMGGASVQITYPCDNCKTSKRVRVKGRMISVFSHSFLGWGQDEAWKKSQPLPACAPGIGRQEPGWQPAECVAGIPLSSDFIDRIKNQIVNTEDRDWYLGGAFRYMRNKDINRYCRQGVDSGFKPETSCFRAVYLEKVLDTLGIPESAEPADEDWTLGAVVCTATQCFQ